MAFSPEQLSAIKKIIEPVKIAAGLNISIEESESYLITVVSFIEKNWERFPVTPFVISCAKSNKKNVGKNLTLQQVNQSVRKDRPYIMVDSLLRHIDSVAGVASHFECTNYTKTNNMLAIFITGPFYYIFLNGVIIEQDNVGASDLPLVISKWEKTVNNLKEIIQDHKKECVDREQQFPYWHDKAKRTLISGPKGTEILFQHSLYWWIDRHVIDAIHVSAESSGMGQDKVDIYIGTVDGNYVLELKWLGCNQNRKCYGIQEVDKGLKQVSIYLDHDKKLVCGYLVAYDARTRDKHENDSSYSGEYTHHHCEEPMILYLESETPSQIANQTIRKVKVKKSPAKKTKKKSIKKITR